MTIRPRFVPTFVLLLAASVTVTACGDDGIVPPAATVEGTTITQEDVADEVEVFLAVTPDARAAFEGPSPSARIEDLNRNALAFLIQQELVDRYAAAQGIEADARQTEGSLQQSIASAGGREQVDAQLRERGLSEADLLAYVNQIVLRQEVATSLAPEGDGQAQNQAFGTWLVDSLQTAAIDVNPRFGALDLQLGQLLPITSTAELG